MSTNRKLRDQGYSVLCMLACHFFPYHKCTFSLIGHVVMPLNVHKLINNSGFDLRNNFDLKIRE